MCCEEKRQSGLFSAISTGCFREPLSACTRHFERLADRQAGDGHPWHQAGFRLAWRWTSRSRGGRPKVPLEIRQLIRNMSLANPLRGAPRIHGELLKLGINVGPTSVAKYMARQLNAG
jgi:hypothetical protein